MTPSELWQRYQTWLCASPAAGLTLDISRMNFSDSFMQSMEPEIQRAFAAMDDLEHGAIANPDENRMVGHYWLRAPGLAPQPAIGAEIEQTVRDIAAFAARIHQEKKFSAVLCIGIGGSALGPMFVSEALGSPAADKMKMAFLDNTDPDGIARTLARLEGRLGETLCIVTSKSGGTPETRNGAILAAAAYKAAGLKFADHVVAITKQGSALDKQAESEGWLARFPMWDWVGGRTSELSAVGLLPAALQGLDIDGILAGARECDEVTRRRDTRSNPAALLALMWHYATNGKGEKDMVVLPYNDRLLLFSRYLQQLVMESLGKERDLQGKVVEQGIAVYGNKGSTDQHAYVQQLREGVNNFFVTFIRVLETPHDSVEVERGVTAGDYLHAFLLGTREALASKGRESITITLDSVNARSVGALIALFERAVGLYASLVGINAYHQPGVEAGKKAAAAVLELQARVIEALRDGHASSEDIARRIGAPDQVETIHLIAEYLRANGRVPSA